MRVQKLKATMIRSLGIGILLLMGWWLFAPTAAEAQPALGQCGKPLPTIEWLGEGTNTYTLGSDFDTFIVKRLPFTLALDAGRTNAAGETIYQATRNERVWRCSGDCALPAVFHSAFELGYQEPGTRINMVVIDDDDDDRRNWWAVGNPLVPYLSVTDQQMVQYLTFDIPVAGDWYYYANDSIGIAATCLAPSPPTATPTATATASATPSPTDTMTPTATATPTATSTATPTATSTTVVVEPPETVTPTASPTATATPPVAPTIGVTPTITPRTPPTALNLRYFTAIPSSEWVTLTWETVFELQVQGFAIWRGTSSNRANAERLTPLLIASRGSASSGATYRYEDADAVVGQQYTYWLVAINSDGSTEDIDSTTAALQQSIYLPLLRY
jgi:hypothetical protein